MVYDACVLYPSTLRDLLIRLTHTALVQAKWTERILDEVFNNLKTDRPDLAPDRLDRTRVLMTRAVRNCIVADYDHLIDLVELPDPDDRHVLAAAVRCRAEVIVTRNLKDFPAAVLQPWGIEACHPDDFVLSQISRDRQSVYAAVQQIADSWRNPPGSPNDVLKHLEVDGLIGSVAALRS